MVNYRDYGSLNNIAQPNVLVDNNKPSQVFLATHKGENYLPFMNRSFISFSFGGKNIEDFNLIATMNGDYIQKNGYSEFEDIVSDYDVLNGHFYWGSRYTNHIISFLLATDGITQSELEKFLNWFSAGKTRELILAEHPNRAIMARVQSAPELSLMPFEKKATIKIANNEYSTSTTLYKGTIDLNLITEDPFWYSKINIFGHLENNIYYDTWSDANGILRSVYDDPDAIKISLEDNIPISSMIQDPMLLGDNKFANSNLGMGGGSTAPKNSYTSSEIASLAIMYKIAKEDGTEGACIAGTIITETGGISEFSYNTNQYFYYCGTAPCAVKLTFTLTPEISNSYIITPINSKSSTGIDGKKYNTITIESINKKEFNFTAPSVYISYNKAIEIFNNAEQGQAWNEIRSLIRDQVNHPAARAWANLIIDSFNNPIIDGASLSNSITRMGYFLKDKDNKLLSSTFEIDNATGIATGKLQYRDIILNGIVPTDWQNYGTVTIHEEDVGDMIRSNHLIIEDRNYPTKDGFIVAWQNINEETRSHSYRISHDVHNGLKNVFVTYRNMYL